MRKPTYEELKEYSGSLESLLHEAELGAQQVESDIDRLQAENAKLLAIVRALPTPNDRCFPSCPHCTWDSGEYRCQLWRSTVGWGDPCHVPDLAATIREAKEVDDA